MAFLQMVKIAAAVELHKRAHLPYLVYLRHPSTGGVFASWGSLGHVTIAQPGALVGFLGPRVYEQLYGEPFPPGIQTAENLQRHGVIDGVVPLKWLRRTVVRALKVLLDEPGAAPPPPPRHEPVPDVPAWESVAASRRPDRPGVGRLLRHGATEQVLLSGTGVGEAATTLLALARFRGQPAVVLGQQKSVAWSGRRRCGKPAAGWRWPRDYGCRWYRSSIRPARRCPRRPSRAGWPGRSRRAWPSW
ncbi:Putative acetyl-coenzyme A carboxylase carboxyl transferase subunit beta [Mycobacterium talmoniae]|uniref:Acetyl-coenzyme A carboxylase carboxyl transferase subunit beta n=1 Tax=Mycobacterium talmoniae TaxID=1858794 RepID=A0A2S8BBH2_9MYCO|nr:Putative acetyl-coenzyme A carboxylase carboxyl transferase subunit beta [Mycobacterium talmoniae]